MPHLRMHAVKRSGCAQFVYCTENARISLLYRYIKGVLGQFVYCTQKT